MSRIILVSIVTLQFCRLKPANSYTQTYTQVCVHHKHQSDRN